MSEQSKISIPRRDIVIILIAALLTVGLLLATVSFLTDLGTVQEKDVPLSSATTTEINESTTPHLDINFTSDSLPRISEAYAATVYDNIDVSITNSSESSTPAYIKVEFDIPAISGTGYSDFYKKTGLDKETFRKMQWNTPNPYSNPYCIATDWNTWLLSNTSWITPVLKYMPTNEDDWEFSALPFRSDDNDDNAFLHVEAVYKYPVEQGETVDLFWGIFISPYINEISINHFNNNDLFKDDSFLMNFEATGVEADAFDSYMDAF